VKASYFKIGECVFVRWDDSCCYSGWKGEDQLAELDFTRCASIGWVIRKTDRIVTLTPNVGVDDGVSFHHSNGHILIPLSAITEVRKLPVPIGHGNAKQLNDRLGSP
jgi:hypothetical protein